MAARPPSGSSASAWLCAIATVVEPKVPFKVAEVTRVQWPLTDCTLS